MADDPENPPVYAETKFQRRQGDRNVEVKGHDVRYVYEAGEQPYGTNNNMVVTSSYTLITFVPLNLFEQFSNLANLYFLFIGILQIIPWISTTKGIPTMYQPLAFIVLVSALRAATEDWAKHQSDAKRNDYGYEVWMDGGFRTIRSGDLKVGHILKVKKNEMIPADLLFIGSALQKGHCFIDKANLNGETTLEVLSSVKETRRYIPWDSWPQDDNPATEHSKPEEKIKLKSFNADVHFEPPNKKFDKLRGTLLLYPPSGGTNYQELSVDGKVLLMRETTLRNCAWIIGIVLYNGNDTKIQKSNSEGGKPKVKKSKIMRLVNKYLLGMLALQIAFCLFGGIYAGVWAAAHDNVWYFGVFPSWETPGLDGFLAFFSWFILLSQMVPISLIVSSEIVKTIQSYFMQWDFTLYYPPIDKPTKVNSSTHHEDLGLVDYVFSDKTGTLTQNKMTFRYALLADGEFGSKETEIARSVKLKQQELAERNTGEYRPRDVTPWTSRVAPLLPDPQDKYKFEVVFVNIKQATTSRIYAQEATVTTPRRRWRTFLERAGNNVSVYLTAETSGPGRTEISADFRIAIINEKNEVIVEEKRNNHIFRSELMGIGTPPKDLSELEKKGAYSAEKDSLHAIVEWIPEEEKNCCERSQWLRRIWVDQEAEDRRRERLSKTSGKAFVVNEFTEEQRHHLLKTLWGKDSDPSLRRHLHLFLCHMALSNTVKPYEEKVGDRKELKFQSESAEESAMVIFAQSCGFTKKSVNPTRLQIKEFSAADFTHPIKEYSEEYEHLATFGFTSARARVTVIYRSKAENHIHVMIKGQDTVLLPLLTKAPNEDELLLDLKNMGNNGLRTLVCGYSILENSWWLDRRAKYEEAIRRDETDASLGHPDKCKKNPACEKCFAHDLFTQYEKDAKLQYLGCLGLEDQLQLLVPETIHDCLRAGVKVWMITGDKLDTAKNIGLATNLIDSDMQVQFSPNEPVEESIKKLRQSRLLEITGQWAELGTNTEQIRSLFDTFDRDNNGHIDRHELKDILEQLGLPEHVLAHTDEVIESLDKDGDGALDKEEFVQFISSTRMSAYDAIKYDIDEAEKIYQGIQNHLTHPVSILVNRRAFEVMFPGKGGEDGGNEKPVDEAELEKLRVKFFDLARKSKSVVFARAQPAMKKKMVTEIMARDPDAITLAIGDGANDTDMITAAHVGVGIAGVEGTAATNSADYAIGTFRMLHTLLFVHGYWNYHRIADLVNFIFYKAALVAMTGYYFGFYSGFSGQQFYNDAIYQLYNVVFTALPIIVVAVLDQKLPRHTLENNPAAFRESKNKAFSFLIFFGWIFRAFVHSLILFFLPVYAVGTHEIHGTSFGAANGTVHGLWFTSTVVYFGVVLVPTFLILFIMLSVTFFHFASIFVSILALFVMCYMWSYFVQLNSDLNGVIAELYADPIAWLTMIISLATPMLLEMIWRGLKRDLRPTLTEILQERIRLRREQTREKTKQRMPKVLEEEEDDEESFIIVHQVPPENKETKECKETKETKNVEIKIPEKDAAENDLVPTGAVRGSSVTLTDENLTHEDESKFYSRKAHRAKTDHKDGMGHIQHAQSYSDGLLSKDENLKRSVIRAMLRFRNITGSTFDSAAQARFQAHDQMGSGVDTKERKGESKEEMGTSSEEFEDPDEESETDQKEKKAKSQSKKGGGSKSDEGDT